VIVRILTARVRERNASTVEALLRRQVQDMRTYDGLRYVKLARQVHPGYEDIMMFEEWRDAEALHAWAGRSLESPRLLPEARVMVEGLGVTHYEAFDITATIPDDARAGADVELDEVTVPDA
jgi:hypothetical protein